MTHVALRVAVVEQFEVHDIELLDDVSFRVGQGDVVALAGPNGAGKSTLLRLASGELKPDAGTVTTSGGLGVMPQFVGSARDDRTVRDLLVSVARPVIRGRGPIAGCTLAAGIAAGLADRKRPFSLLRLTGAARHAAPCRRAGRRPSRCSPSPKAATTGRFSHRARPRCRLCLAP